MRSIHFTQLRELAASLGLSLVGVADVGVLAEDRDRLRDWQESEFCADMSFMKRDPQLLSSPLLIAHFARSIAVFGVFYDRRESLPLPRGNARVARYAWGRDYHKVLRKRIGKLVEVVQQQLGVSVQSKVFSDSVPLLERALARQAGLGFIGKNSMVIVPRQGSFMFLGEVLWDLDIDGYSDHSLDGTQADNPTSLSGLGPRCGGCTNCSDLCPTGALVADRVLDARRCISYLTIEKRGALSELERRWIGEWIFGCDICQDVCPFNLIPIKKRAAPDCAELGADYGVGQSLNLVEVLAIRSDQDFIRRFAGTAIMRAKRVGLVRNAAVVAANKKLIEALPALKEAALNDSSPVVRGHALWAFASIAKELGSDALQELKGLVSHSANDPDQEVRNEVASIFALGPCNNQPKIQD